MKTILLIGAGGGMGRACAKQLQSDGDRVIGLDRTVECMPDGMERYAADVTRADMLSAAYEAIRANTDALDAIVYAAGMYDMDSLVEIDEQRMTGIFDVNVFGAYRAIKTFFPLLRAGSRVVFVTSELAPLDPLPFTGLYGITKGTLEGYAFSLAMELQLLSIAVSVIRPGAVETPLLDRSVERIEAFAARTKLYPGQAKRFLRVTQSVESKSVPPEAVAKKLIKVLHKKRPRYLYTLNRNPLLLLFGRLPKQWQLGIIKTYLSK